MAEGYVQLPDDGTGKKVRAFSSVVGGHTVYHQASVPTDPAGNEVGAYTSRVDEVSSSLIYSGVAAPGTLPSAAAWRIKRVSVSGSVTTVAWAGGNTNFEHVWNDRASLAYS